MTRVLQEGTWHVAIIRTLVEATEGCTYVEVGVRSGATFNRVAPYAANAHAVDIELNEDFDPITGKFWHMSSDQFFTEYREAADVVFIDADHEYDQAARDFAGAVGVLSRNGTILLHDTWPVDRVNLRDTGSVWELAAELERRDDLNVFTYRRYPGLTLVQRPCCERFECES